MLRADNVSFRYETGPWILSDTSIGIRPGEVVGLPGPSGRGKTTLARLLGGYLHPEKGRIGIGGDKLPRRGFHPVQLVFQHPELAMNPRWKAWRILSEAGEPDPQVVEALGICHHWFSRYPHELSGGELQRLALARAMNPATRYIVADEMTAMLDPNTQALIWNVVLDWAQRRNVGILAVSHDRKLLSRVADRVESMFDDMVAFPENEKGREAA
ncbi:ABC transporter ATP-binding protein [Desulfovibrio oxyclinae]|uniref:ABC transporter ATP-binding protein n=1 Tax=Desulfovibrio oxyclinae TaxID=63560 RepID=UPI0003728772|nr:ATP-binding cassette domain-containing protein [Desulfovibrio oxyclinae]